MTVQHDGGRPRFQGAAAKKGANPRRSAQFDAWCGGQFDAWLSAKFGALRCPGSARSGVEAGARPAPLRRTNRRTLRRAGPFGSPAERAPAGVRSCR
jgi:hypothetical protein